MNDRFSYFHGGNVPFLLEQHYNSVRINVIILHLTNPCTMILDLCCSVATVEGAGRLTELMEKSMTLFSGGL